ncbi:hypothetical protein WDH52_21605 [Streptomyces sp. TRM70308]
MEPRELWERNTVLAEAFCASDDRVRQAQSVLDEAQAERTRMLAAFAVTVGNDSAVADLMGLHEREVRVARRTVGKEDARTMASGLLKPAPQPPPAEESFPAPEPEADGVTPHEPVRQPPEAEVHVPRQRGEFGAPTGTPHPEAQAARAHPAPAQAAPGFVPPQAAQVFGPPAQPFTASHPAQPFVTPEPSAEPSREPQGAPPYAGAPRTEAVREAEGWSSWSSSMDSVLVWSWQSGVDLQFVAEELGLDLRALLVRVQTLAAEGRLSLHAPPHSPHADTAGRHRRRQAAAQAEEYLAAPADAVGPFAASTHR